MTTTATQFAVRPMFESDGDYETYARIYSAYYPDDPVTPEYKKATVAGRPVAMDCRDFLATWDGEPAAVGINMRPVWMKGEDVRLVHYSIGLAYVGHPVEAAFLRFLIEDARRSGAARIHTPLEDHHPCHRSNVEAEGFTLSQRQLVTRIDVQAFDPSRFASLMGRLEAEGVSIRSLEEMRSEGEGWFDAFYSAHSEIEADVPSPEPSQAMPRDEFRKYLDTPAFVDPRGMFVAFEGDECLGVSSIMPNPADRRLGLTRLTGVCRQHRRRGVATALKVRAIDWAKCIGIERVLTDNEENNPMYKLNKALGFEDAHQILVYSREA